VVLHCTDKRRTPLLRALSVLAAVGVPLLPIRRFFVVEGMVCETACFEDAHEE